MEVIHSIADLRSRIKDFRRKNDQSVGFVPTMGYLHEGHASLLRKARAQSGLVVLSIFVNPLQFGPGEDFERYPRNTERDLQLAEAAGVDLVFMPSVSEMYPAPTHTTVSVTGLTSRLCGASRPGHFDGVATVVSKLFHIVQPDQAFFGLKDAQQVAVIEQMVQDLNLDIEIVPCPILREADGLAMSSRNVYLSEEERKQAIVLSQSLQKAKAYVESHAAFTPQELESLVSQHLATAPLAIIDYVEVLAYPTLEPFENSHHTDSIIIALAVKFGKTRLIDNLILQVRK
ncbi:pantoate--beta-alanine ligase [Paenibacillus alginolyticus]|uniref:Pantothenate synthetase n=1 Tax=Paenibacillus alginolyticus TaxID=59839 RepID=A0ABT4GCW1_9BACL|nr:pantoate--beta-alanine ligase [Paenibacillus alginolyticus]MCY9664669.1 pantoate--beta-alanine ligase [Paenibacillus alginolyticus]MCY9693987.1 pantoate--beta-alanine ligase [Paenibacillus alginolyticus]MEC0142655.1 pantoate--beta-alanine ligase [Paenibacillus alginolyticus]